MVHDRICIRMEAYDHRALDVPAKEIVDHPERTSARMCGPIPSVRTTVVAEDLQPMVTRTGRGTQSRKK